MEFTGDLVQRKETVVFNLQDSNNCIEINDVGSVSTPALKTSIGRWLAKL